MENFAIKFLGFRLVSLEVIDNKILGTNIFKFVDYQDSPDSIYFSVIIGSNGTGKSEILRLILRLFRNICLLDQERKTRLVDGLYKLVYVNHEREYTFTNIPKDYNSTNSDELSLSKSHIRFLVDSKETNFENAKTTLPLSIVANSIMLTDKYIVPRNETEQADFPMYNYLGVRNRPQQASTRSYVRKTVEFIVEQVESFAFKDGLKRLTKFLELEQSIKVSFTTTYTKKFYKEDLQKRELDEYFNEIEKKYKESESIAPFKLNHYHSLVKEEGLVEDICEFMRSMVKNKRLEHIYRSTAKNLSYDIIDDKSHQDLKWEYKYLDHLRKLGLMKPPEVLMNNDSEIPIQNTSSGEFHLFSTMVGLMASMKPFSLIIIDEPEISLHPNWQMKYIELIRELFSNEEYRSCQFIIATHSHFLISDLEGRSSNIIGLKKIKENAIQTVQINTDTFGWSAEEILLEIFKVPTTRNLYIAEKIGTILDEIAKSDKDLSFIKSEIKYLQDKNIDKLSKEDPLKEIVDKLIEKYG